MLELVQGCRSSRAHRKPDRIGFLMQIFRRTPVATPEERRAKTSLSRSVASGPSLDARDSSAAYAVP